MSKNKNKAQQAKRSTPVTPVKDVTATATTDAPKVEETTTAPVTDAAVTTENETTTETVTATTDAPKVDEIPATTVVQSEKPKEDKKTSKPESKPTPAKEEAASDKAIAKAKEVAQYYPKEKTFLVTEDGSVFLETETSAAGFHAKSKKQKLFVFNVADATLNEA